VRGCRVARAFFLREREREDAERRRRDEQAATVERRGAF
jgi:hypothetical protein